MQDDIIDRLADNENTLPWRQMNEEAVFTLNFVISG